MNAIRPESLATPEDMAQSRRWLARFFSNASALPISFVLDGQPLRAVPQEWQPVSHTRCIDANLCETVFEGTDPRTGLHVRVECTRYRDHPVVEWVAWFSNRGQASTPLLCDILAMDGAFDGSAPEIVHCNGDFYSEQGYTPQQTRLLAGDTLAFAPNGGRPCDGAFPYYRILFEGGGLSLAIGWPAQWAASFTGLADGVTVRAGQQKTALRLLPGESIRTPRMTILSWSGDSSRAVNLWRRWYLAHILPRPDGQPLRPLLSCAGTDEGEEFTAATEDNQLRYMERFRARGLHFDVWWIDAGWYPCYNQDHERKWVITGSWEPDPERFPNGLKPVSDAAALGGADLLVWFEPERVRPGTRLEVEHPEWLLRAQGNENALLYLGNPACRQWLTDHVCRLIQDNAIRIYRQDHNFQPLGHWRQNEAKDRQGLNENLHVQGYLRFWDDLLARNPGLWIDSCSSGGRRNDLETMRRSVPLHYTDYGYGDHPVKLGFHRTLFEWIPYFKETTLSWDLAGKARFAHRVDSYSYHCAMAPMLALGLDIRRDDYDYVLAGSLVQLWRRAADLILHGDYYPHTPFPHSAEGWVVWQFDRPETGCGLLQGVRFPDSSAANVTVHPREIHAGAMYTFENPETGEVRDLAGADLIERGFTLALPPRNGAIWFYRARLNV